MSMDIDGKIEELREKPASLPLCPSQIIKFSNLVMLFVVKGWATDARTSQKVSPDFVAVHAGN
jgi:hypothetical protein